MHELMETPPLRVSRPVSACARCRTAKIKCDGKLPACSACERAGKSRDCSSANDQFAKGKERSYVASLESRIERLQRQIVANRRQSETAHPDSLHVANDAAMGEGNHRGDTSEVNELVSDFGYLSVNATASGYHGFTEEMSFSRLVLSTATIMDLPRVPSAKLPPREEAVVMIQECVQRVFTLYPVLVESILFASLETVYQHDGRYSMPLDMWNIRLVLAISCLGRSERQGDVEYRQAVSHASIALGQREAVLQPGSVATVQSLLLLILYSLLDSAHFNSWYLIGVAARLMVDIGLHQEPEAEFGSRLRPAQLETRRRVFYCVYALDRVISMTHIKCFSFTDDSVNVILPAISSLPSADQHVPFESSTSPALQLFEFRRVQSMSFQAVFGSTRSILHEPWQSRIPALIKVADYLATFSNSVPQFLKCLLYAEMYYLDVLLIHPPGSKTELDSCGIVLLFESCFGYIQSMSSICDSSGSSAVLTILDSRRVMHVASAITRTIMNSYDMVLGVGYSTMLPHNLREALPSLLSSDPANKVDQAINIIAQLETVVRILFPKFGQTASLEQIENDAGAVKQRLYTSKERITMAANNHSHQLPSVSTSVYNSQYWQ